MTISSVHTIQFYSKSGHDQDRFLEIHPKIGPAQDPILCKTLIETNDIHMDEFSRPLGKLKIRKNIWINFPEFGNEGSILT